MTEHAVLLPGATLGVMGGGQLGRMFVHAAQTLGYFTAVLDPDESAPAGLVGHRQIRAAYDDAQGLAELARVCGAVTTEFENVPAQSLRTLAQSRPVAPDARAVAIAQDRAQEKAHFDACGVRCVPYALIENDAQLAAVPTTLVPGILKTARLGYDGKGQRRVKTMGELADAWRALGQVPCVLEQWMPLAAEVSVIVARGRDGQMIDFPVQLNLHRDGILAVTQVYPGNVSEALGRQAVAAARAIAAQLGYVGVLCVEFFVLPDGSLLVNEMAPRPHNSGHYSIDACDVSQFEAQVRTLAGLPLVAPRQHSAAIMLNLLGDLWYQGDRSKASEPDWPAVLRLPGAHLHLYGKMEARVGRKMGHLTLTGARIEDVRPVALQAAAILGIEAFA